MLATLPRVVAFARSLLRDHAAAEDVAHDCYCRILAKADVYDIPRRTKVPFCAITNACIDRTGRDRRHQSLDADPDTDGVPEPADFRVPTPATPRPAANSKTHSPPDSRNCRRPSARRSN